MRRSDRLWSSQAVPLSLAEAGYVVAAPTHTADNYRDKSGFGTLRVVAGRPRHVKDLVDYMLAGWPGHDRLDAGRIGFFGFSAGGYTGLIALGGQYLNGTKIKLGDLRDNTGGAELIVEAAGIASLSFSLLDALAPGGA